MSKKSDVIVVLDKDNKIHEKIRENELSKKSKEIIVSFQTTTQFIMN